ncbi:hypothetical protein MMC30_007202 [Trapelia coarctata]|nr:hypothetical protein [Trapelia coarctata]
MYHSGALAGGENRWLDPDVEALQRAASRAEEAASRVEQHGLIRGSLHTGQDESPMSAPVMDLRKSSEVTEPRIFGHNQVALRAEATAASVHAMVHQSMHTATEFAVPSRRNHTNGDQFFRVGVDGRSGFEKIPRAESRPEAAAARVESHVDAVQYSNLSADEAASSIGPVRQSRHVDIVPKPDHSLKVPVPLTPDDSCEDSSEKHSSKPPFSSFDSEPRVSPLANTSLLEHTAVSSSNANTSSSKRGRPRNQNFIDRLARESEQPSPEAPVVRRKRGRPRGSKSSTYTKKSTEKLQNGETILSFPAGRSSQASPGGPTVAQTPTIGPPLPLTVQGSLGESTRLERTIDDASSLGVSVQSRNMSISSTGTALAENSLTKVSSVTGSQVQLAQENDLLKTLFKTEIGPIMDNVMKSYESRLPRDVLIAVGKAFASEILNKKLRQSLREGEQAVTPLFKRIAQGTLQRMLLQKLRERQNLSTGPLANSSANSPLLFTPQGLASAAEVGTKYRESSGPPKMEEGRRSADLRSRSVNEDKLDQSMLRTSQGIRSATETSGDFGNRQLSANLKMVEVRRSVEDVQKDILPGATMPNKLDFPFFSSSQEPTPTTHGSNDHRRGLAHKSMATRVDNGEICDVPEVETLDEVEMLNASDHSSPDGEHIFGSSSNAPLHELLGLGARAKSAVEVYSQRARTSAISGKYEKRSDEVLKGRKGQPAMRDIQNWTSNTYSLDGGSSPRPDCGSGSVPASGREPYQPGVAGNSTVGGSSGADLPSPQLQAASLSVLRSSELFHAEDLVGKESDVNIDTSKLDGQSPERHQPEDLNTSTSEHFSAIGLQPRPRNVTSGSLVLLFDTTDTILESRQPGAVLNTTEETRRSSSQPEIQLRDSNEVDSRSRPQLTSSHPLPSEEVRQPQPASSRSQPPEGVPRPQQPPQVPQQHTEITDEMKTRGRPRVDYTEPDPYEEPDPVESDSESRVRRRRRRAERSPSPPPDSTAFRHVCYVPQPVTRNCNSILRHRELGMGRWHVNNIGVKAMNGAIRTHFSQRLGCWRSWTGASKDIVTAAWSPIGSMYAVGASTEMDNLNIQYNRPNNLLLGNNNMNTLTELPNHYIDRPRPETIRSGDNARQSTYNALDPELYTTVSHVCFNHEGDRLFSTSFDKTLKIWDVASGKKATCLQTIQQEAQIELLALSYKPMVLLATGQRTTYDPIRIYDIEKYGLEDSENDSTAEMNSVRATKFKLYPTCVQWGPSPSTDTMLLAGFSENRTDGRLDQEGDLCLWDASTDLDDRGMKLSPSAQAVMDITWHPTLPMFAAATVPGSRTNLADRRTQSVIRTYQYRTGPGRIMEYECPGLDINDVRFHPFDDHYISAGCTNGTTYVWDSRMPETIMQKLRHGLPIDTLDHTLSREEQDTGVRFTAWGRDGLNLYTGSSDGTIKAWNIFASPEDASVRDVAQFDAGVMTGSFSPDQTDLIVGLSKGSVHVLSSAPHTHNPNEDDEDEDSWSDTEVPRKAYEAIGYVESKRRAPAEAPTGIDIARDLLASLQLEMHPIYGAGKGPNYKGSYAEYARAEGADPTFEDLDPDILAGQLDHAERRRGRKLGGNQDKEARQRYREAEKLAEARNGPSWFQERKSRGNKWQFKKGEVWWDTEADDEPNETKGMVGDGDVKQEEMEVMKETVAAVWEGKEIIVIDDD